MALNQPMVGLEAFQPGHTRGESYVILSPDVYRCQGAFLCPGVGVSVVLPASLQISPYN